MTKDKPVDTETFYLHCLRYYMKPIIKNTWRKYSLGVGIFNMQGFERRNKESKRTMLKNNLKGNIVQQNLSSLYTIFEDEIL